LESVADSLRDCGAKTHYFKPVKHCLSRWLDRTFSIAIFELRIEEKWNGPPLRFRNGR